MIGLEAPLCCLSLAGRRLGRWASRPPCWVRLLVRLGAALQGAACCRPLSRARLLAAGSPHVLPSVAPFALAGTPGGSAMPGRCHSASRAPQCVASLHLFLQSSEYEESA